MLGHVSCSVGCDVDAASLDSALAVLCSPVADAPLLQPLLPGDSAVLLAVALLPRDERVMLPSLSVPRPTRMIWDRGRILAGSLHFLQSTVIVKRRNSCVGELQVLLRRKQGVHQLNGMRRKHIRFAPRKSVHVSEGCDVTKDAISYPQQPLRPHYSTKRKICTMRSVPQKSMDNSLVPFNPTRRNLASGEPADSTLQHAATTFSP